MGQLQDENITQNTAGGKVTLEHSRWVSYVRTQQMGQMLNTENGTDIIPQQMRQLRWDSYIKTQQMRHSYLKRAHETVTLGQLC